MTHPAPTLKQHQQYEEQLPPVSALTSLYVDLVKRLNDGKLQPSAGETTSDSTDSSAVDLTEISQQITAVTQKLQPLVLDLVQLPEFTASTSLAELYQYVAAASQRLKSLDSQHDTAETTGLLTVLTALLQDDDEQALQIAVSNQLIDNSLLHIQSQLEQAEVAASYYQFIELLHRLITVDIGSEQLLQSPTVAQCIKHVQQRLQNDTLRDADSDLLHVAANAINTMCFRSPSSTLHKSLFSDDITAACLNHVQQYAQSLSNAHTVSRLLFLLTALYVAKSRASDVVPSTPSRDQLVDLIASFYKSAFQQSEVNIEARTDIQLGQDTDAQLLAHCVGLLAFGGVSDIDRLDDDYLQALQQPTHLTRVAIAMTKQSAVTDTQQHITPKQHLHQVATPMINDAIYRTSNVLRCNCITLNRAHNYHLRLRWVNAVTQLLGLLQQQSASPQQQAQLIAELAWSVLQHPDSIILVREIQLVRKLLAPALLRDVHVDVQPLLSTLIACLLTSPSIVPHAEAGRLMQTIQQLDFRSTEDTFTPCAIAVQLLMQLVQVDGSYWSSVCTILGGAGQIHLLLQKLETEDRRLRSSDASTSTEADAADRPAINRAAITDLASTSIQLLQLLTTHLPPMQIIKDDHNQLYHALIRLAASQWDELRDATLQCLEAAFEPAMLPPSLAVMSAPSSRSKQLASRSSAKPSGEYDIAPPISRAPSTTVTADTAFDKVEAPANGTVPTDDPQWASQMLISYLHTIFDQLYKTSSLAAKASYLRSLQRMCTHSRRVQELFRFRGGFYNLAATFDSLRVPELQRRVPLRSTTRTSDSDANSDKPQVSAEVQGVYEVVYHLVCSIIASCKGNAKSRAIFQRGGLDRFLSAIKDSQFYLHPQAKSSVIVWLLYLAIETVPPALTADDGTASAGDDSATTQSAVNIDTQLNSLPGAAIISLPSAVSSVLSMLTDSSSEWQNSVLSFMRQACSTSLPNRAALGRVNTITSLIVNFQSALLSGVTDAQQASTLWSLIEMLLPYSASVLDASTLMNLLEFDEWKTVAQHLSTIAVNTSIDGQLQPALHLEQPMSKAGAYLSIDNICGSSNLVGGASAGSNNSVWPAAVGYTLSLWCWLDGDATTDSPNNRLTQQYRPLYTVLNADRRPILRVGVAGGYIVMSVESGDHSASTTSQPGSQCVFDAYRLQTSRWYHLLLSHTPQTLLANSKATLYVNGATIQTCKVNYPETSSSTTRAIVGSNPLLKTLSLNQSIHQRSKSRSHRLSTQIPVQSTYVQANSRSHLNVDEDVSSSTDGDRSRSNSPRDATTKPSPRQVRNSISVSSDISSAPSLGWRIAAVTMFAEVIESSEVATHLYMNKPLTSATPATALNSPTLSAVAPDKLSEQYATSIQLALLHTLQSDSSTADKQHKVPSQSTSKPTMTPNPAIRPSSIYFHYHSLRHAVHDRSVYLVNCAEMQAPSLARHAKLNGHCHIYKPRAVGELVSRAGGVKRLLPLLSRSGCSDELNSALEVIAAACIDHSASLREIQDNNLHQLIAYALKHKVKHINTRTVELLLALSGVYDDGSSGEIVDATVIQTYVLDYSLWRRAAMDVQVKLFYTMLNVVTANPHNMQHQRMLRSVGWISYLCSLLADKDEYAMRSADSPLLGQIMACIAAAEWKEEDAKLLTELALNVTTEANKHDASSSDASTASGTTDNSMLTGSLVIRNAILDVLLTVLMRSSNSTATVDTHIATQRKKRLQMLSHVITIEYLTAIITCTEVSEDVQVEQLHLRTLHLSLSLLSLLLQRPTYRQRFQLSTSYYSLAKAIQQTGLYFNVAVIDALVAASTTQLPHAQNIANIADEPSISPTASDSNGDGSSQRPLPRASSASGIISELSPHITALTQNGTSSSHAGKSSRSMFDVYLRDSTSNTSKPIVVPELLLTTMLVLQYAMTNVDTQSSEPNGDQTTATEDASEEEKTITKLLHHFVASLLTIVTDDNTLRHLFLLPSSLYMHHLLNIIQCRAAQTHRKRYGEEAEAVTAASTLPVSTSISNFRLADPFNADGFGASPSMATAGLDDGDDVHVTGIQLDDEFDEHNSSSFVEAATTPSDRFVPNAQLFSSAFHSLDESSHRVSAIADMLGQAKTPTPDVDASGSEDQAMIEWSSSLADDSCIRIAYRLLAQLAFHALLNNRPVSATSNSSPTLTATSLSGKSVIASAMTSMTLSSSNSLSTFASSTANSSTDGCGLIDDILDGGSSDMAVNQRVAHVTRMLRVLSQHIYERPQQWSALLTTNTKLSTNFGVFVSDILYRRIECHQYRHGAILVLECLFALMESGVENDDWRIRSTTRSWSSFSLLSGSTAKNKARLVDAIAETTQKIVLYVYQQAIQHRHTSDLVWINSLLLKHLDRLSEFCANTSFAGSCAYQLLQQIQQRELWLTSDADKNDDSDIRVLQTVVQVLCHLLRLQLPVMRSMLLPPSEWKPSQQLLQQYQLKGSSADYRKPVVQLLQKCQTLDITAIQEWTQQHPHTITLILAYRCTSIWSSVWNDLLQRQSLSEVHIRTHRQAILNRLHSSQVELDRSVETTMTRINTLRAERSVFDLVLARLRAEDTNYTMEEEWRLMLKQLKSIQKQLHEQEESIYQQRIELSVGHGQQGDLREDRSFNNLSSNDASSNVMTELERLRDMQREWKLGSDAELQASKLSSYKRELPVWTEPKTPSVAHSRTASNVADTNAATARKARRRSSIKEQQAASAVDARKSLLDEVASKAKAAAPPEPPTAPASDIVVGSGPAPPPLAPAMGAPNAPPMAPPIGVPSAPGMPPPPPAMGFAPSLNAAFKTPAPAKTKRLHWDAISDMSNGDSVWSELQSNQRAVPSNLELEELESQFANKPAAKMKKPGEELADGENGKDKQPTRLVDVRRAGNVEIGISRFGSSVDEIIAALKDMNVSALSVDQWKRLGALLPQPDEVKLIKTYTTGDKAADVTQMGLCEAFFVKVMAVSDWQTRYDVAQCMVSFDTTVTALDGDLHAVIDACDTITRSAALRDVLTIVLAIGNYMNQSTAGGFHLSTLSRLQGTKSTDNKSTLLHFLVQHVQNSCPESRTFVDDINEIKPAQRIDVQVLNEELSTLRKQLATVRRSLTSVSDHKYHAIVQQFYDTAEDKFDAVEKLYKQMQQTSERVSRFFGESKDTSYSEIFNQLIGFSTSYIRAEQELVDAKQRVEEQRRARKNREQMAAIAKKQKSKQAA